MSQELSAASLFQTDAQLVEVSHIFFFFFFLSSNIVVFCLQKTALLEQHTKLPSDDVLYNAQAALEARGHKVTIVETGAEALELIQKLIPDGATVNNASSTSLQQIGYSQWVRDETRIRNLHNEVLAEKDFAKAAELRRIYQVSDYFLSSVPAISEQGEFIVADAAGNRAGPFLASAKNGKRKASDPR
jgi:hypothetical protein